jgi:FkbM family methyltransferase
VYRPNTSDEEVIKQIFENRDYDLAPVRRGDDLVACRRAQAKDGKKPLIVDVGANTGAASLYAHRAFPDARIVAVEPDRQNFELLVANAAGFPISCRLAAVTSRPTLVRVVDPGQGQMGIQNRASDGWCGGRQCGHRRRAGSDRFSIVNLTTFIRSSSKQISRAARTSCSRIILNGSNRLRWSSSSCTTG